MSRQSIFSTWSPPIPKFIPFIETKYLVYTFAYRVSPAIIKSPSTSVLGFDTSIYYETVLSMKLCAARLIKKSSCLKPWKIFQNLSNGEG